MHKHLHIGLSAFLYYFRKYIKLLEDKEGGIPENAKFLIKQQQFRKDALAYKQALEDRSVDKEKKRQACARKLLGDAKIEHMAQQRRLADQALALNKEKLLQVEQKQLGLKRTKFLLQQEKEKKDEEAEQKTSDEERMRREELDRVRGDLEYRERLLEEVANRIRAKSGKNLLNDIDTWVDENKKKSKMCKVSHGIYWLFHYLHTVSPIHRLARSLTCSKNQALTHPLTPTLILSLTFFHSLSHSILHCFA